MSSTPQSRSLSRRSVLAGAAGLGATALLATQAPRAEAMSAATAGRTQFVAAEVSARDVEILRTYQSLSASDLHPTGYYLPPNVELTVTVAANSAAEGASIVVGAPDAEVDVEKRASRTYPITGRRVTIADPYGGPVYWKVLGSKGYLKATLGPTAQPMPFFIYGQTTEDEFQNQLDRRETPYVQLVSAHAMLSIQREAALRWRGENHAQLMETWEEIVRIEDNVAGLDDKTPTHARLTHRYHFVTRAESIANVGAFATHGHMLFPAPIQDRLLTVEALRLRGWGPYHELGHQHQQTVYKPTDLTEVTVNLYSLAVNAAFAKYGQAPRLHVPENDGVPVWESAPPKIGTPDVDFLTTFTVMEKLVMFEQLRLAFGDQFQPAVHKLVREEQPDSGDYSDNDYRLGMLALYYSKAAGRDLRTFFARWGLRYDPSFDDRIAALALPEPEVDPTTLRDDDGAALAAQVLASPRLRRANGLV
ncbi:M60 family metallopeptidase [Isoptericola hypogeus]|uniref:M60 family metallopeptidase n=1 Tax=Isoptericola hypogeus TaxID=300179 RepID=A0ABN2JIT7_9MICO